MRKLTDAEAKMRAHQVALAAVQHYHSYGMGFSDLGPEDQAAVRAELKRIEDLHRHGAVGKDRILGRQLGKELGNQVKPTGKLARQIERLAGGAGHKPKGGG